MKKISIEYAHIYTHNKISEDQNLSLQVLKDIFSERNIAQKDVSLVIMVDDYSFPDPTFNYHDFSQYLSENNFPPDIIIRESFLIQDCDRVISLIEDNHLQSEIISYIQEKKKYTCSLFIATWYLIRLGCIKTDFFQEQYIAETLINILPESFKPFEDKAFEIISKTPFAYTISNIENNYFQGRLL